MIRTVVCEKEGCSGNSFYLENKDEKLILTCKECGSNYEIDVSYYDYTLLSECSRCRNDTFKIFRDRDKEGIYLKCVECGGPPEHIYLDEYGNQINYESKILNDVKDRITLLDQRMFSLEKKMEELENGQNLIEESLAYVSKFLTERS